MSIIATLYNATFEVKRMATVTASSTSSLTTLSSGNQGVIRPIQNTTQLFNLANWGKEYRLWCPTTVDVKANDIVVSGGVTYGVDGVSVFEDLHDTIENHLRVVITKK